ncbi:MAG: hypothetical protein FWG63_03030 [Defluviitaleaceae bacterium]|nr:hypothetical protein [Defluviitaleaceae bacterium]
MKNKQTIHNHWWVGMDDSMKEEKCKECSKDIKKIRGAEPTLYWLSEYPTAIILTPNGETVYCKLQGELNDAHGIGLTLHTCGQEG